MNGFYHRLLTHPVARVYALDAFKPYAARTFKGVKIYAVSDHAPHIVNGHYAESCLTRRISAVVQRNGCVRNKGLRAGDNVPRFIVIEPNMLGLILVDFKRARRFVYYPPVGARRTADRAAYHSVIRAVYYAVFAVRVVRRINAVVHKEGGNVLRVRRVIFIDDYILAPHSYAVGYARFGVHFVFRKAHLIPAEKHFVG